MSSKSPIKITIRSFMPTGTFYMKMVNFYTLHLYNVCTQVFHPLAKFHDYEYYAQGQRYTLIQMNSWVPRSKIVKLLIIFYIRFLSSEWQWSNHLIIDLWFFILLMYLNKKTEMLWIGKEGKICKTFGPIFLRRSSTTGLWHTQY